MLAAAWCRAPLNGARLRVQLAEAVPVPGSQTQLPFDLHYIATRCHNAYYAPNKFSAVQLAYAEPRCRVLIFRESALLSDTFVGDAALRGASVCACLRRYRPSGGHRHAATGKPTYARLCNVESATVCAMAGCKGHIAARLALMRTQQQLFDDVGICVHLRDFAVINQVGAVSLQATLNCEEFASAHTATTFYDIKSFVGMAWRPAGEPICCEIYSTGKANLPGSTCERELYDSFARMLPELLRFSSAARLLHLVPTELQSAHRAKIAPTTPQAVRTSANAKAGGSASASLWDGWLNADDPDHNDCSESADDGDYADEEEEQEDDTLDLAAYF